MLKLTLHGDKIRIRSDQVEERVNMAHPGLSNSNVTFVVAHFGEVHAVHAFKINL